MQSTLTDQKLARLLSLGRFEPVALLQQSGIQGVCAKLLCTKLRDSSLRASSVGGRAASAEIREDARHQAGELIDGLSRSLTSDASVCTGCVSREVGRNML